MKYTLFELHVDLQLDIKSLFISLFLITFCKSCRFPHCYNYGQEDQYNRKMDNRHYLKKKCQLHFTTKIIISYFFIFTLSGGKKINNQEDHQR